MNQKDQLKTSMKRTAPSAHTCLRAAKKSGNKVLNSTYLLSWLLLFLFIVSVLAGISAGAENDSISDMDSCIEDFEDSAASTNSRSSTSMRLENTNLSVTDSQGNPVKTIYPSAGPYMFKTHVKMKESLNSLSTVTLYIDPSGFDLSVKWNFIGDIFSEINDPMDYITLNSTESSSSNNGVDTWYISFALDFNWDYPETASTDCRVQSETFASEKASDFYPTLFYLENDLAFYGIIIVKDSLGQEINENSWVRAYETLTWSGLTLIFNNSDKEGEPVYPDLSGVNYRLTEESSGNFWLTPVESGIPLDMNISTGAVTIDNAHYTLSLYNLPATVKLVSYPSFKLNIDTEPLEFYDGYPSQSEFFFDDTKVQCGISIIDQGGSGVDTNTIEYTISIHGTTKYGLWQKVDGGSISVFTLDDSVDVNIEATFINGTDNYIKWRAKDKAGNGDINGYYESQDYQIKIDYKINHPPTIILDLPQNNTIVDSNEPVAFSCLKTVDPENDELTFSWESNITGLLSNESTFQTILAPGQHTITLKVDDGFGHTSTKSIKVTVRAPEEEPSSHAEGESGLIFQPTQATAGTATILVILTLYFFGGTEVGKYKLLGFVIPLYSKLTKQMVLDHETRGIIRGYILANPGDHFTSIKKHIGLKNGTLAYHLKILEREQIIKSYRDGIFKRFYPMNVKISPEMVHMSKQEVILNTIIESPGITRKELALKIGLSRQVVNYHSKGLIQSGLIRSEKYGKKIQYYPNDPILPDINQ